MAKTALLYVELIGKKHIAALEIVIRFCRPRTYSQPSDSVNRWYAGAKPWAVGPIHRRRPSSDIAD
jgi:hypothetical protein